MVRVDPSPLLERHLLQGSLCQPLLLALPSALVQHPHFALSLLLPSFLSHVSGCSRNHFLSRQREYLLPGPTYSQWLQLLPWGENGNFLSSSQTAGSGFYSHLENKHLASRTDFIIFFFYKLIFNRGLYRIHVYVQTDTFLTDNSMGLGWKRLCSVVAKDTPSRAALSGSGPFSSACWWYVLKQLRWYFSASVLSSVKWGCS